MDIVQIFGDYTHLLGMIILLAKVWLTKNCAGELGVIMVCLFVYIPTAAARARQRQPRNSYIGALFSFLSGPFFQALWAIDRSFEVLWFLGSVRACEVSTTVLLE